MHYRKGITTSIWEYVVRVESTGEELCKFYEFKELCEKLGMDSAETAKARVYQHRAKPWYVIWPKAKALGVTVERRCNWEC